MSNNNLNKSRRGFLEFAAKSGMAGNALKGSSLLAGLLANRYAQANNGVKRVVFVYTPMGSPNGWWLPQGNELNAATQAYQGLQSVCHFHEADVVHANFGLMWKALGKVRFAPDWTGDTIDHQIAKVLGVATPYPSLFFGVQTGGSESVSRHNGQLEVPLEGPQLTYERLFGGTGDAAPAHSETLGQKQNVLDAHMEAINCSWAALGSDEVAAIEQYENSLSALRARLDGNTAELPACRQPDWNGNDYSPQPGNEPADFAQEAYLQAEVITHALSCGLTNVATLQLSNQEGALYAPDTTFPPSIHVATCSIPGHEVYAEMTNYLSGCVAYLIKQLAAQDDPAVPGTKLLDNTLVVQVSDMGYGPDHSGTLGPNVIATGLPEFKTGLATTRKSYDDVNLRVLQTVAAGLGLESYIGKENHHCIWPCGEDWGGINTDLLT